MKKLSIKIQSLAGVVAALTLASATSSLQAQTTNVYVDPSQTWVGYMNVFDLSWNYQFGSSWGTADLQASFNNGVVTLAPNVNVYNATDTYWVNPDGSGAKNMDASFYVQNDGLAGQTVTFSGYCWTNTLVAPYAATAFIKDFAPDYSSNTPITTNLTGGFFSITLTTAPGDHIQYGFETTGPDANPATVSTLGHVLVSSNPPPTAPVITGTVGTNTVVLGSTATFAVSAVGSSLTYQWQKNGVNLTNGPTIAGAQSATLVLSNVTAAAEANYTVEVGNSGGNISSTGRLIVVNPAHLTMDPSAIWQGYMNVFDLSGNYQFGSAWGTADLRAAFNSAVLTLAPNTNTYNPTDAYWVNPDGSGNESMDALFYQQFDGLAGDTVTFVGYCPAYTLDTNDTCTAFIRDFNPSYALAASTNLALAAGQSFSITLATTAGDHIQWGFETIGADANPATAASLGNVQVSIAPPVLAVSRTGTTNWLSFATEVGLTYTLQYKTNLTDSTWQTAGSVTGDSTTQTIVNVSPAGSRYYQLSIQ